MAKYYAKIAVVLCVLTLSMHPVYAQSKRMPQVWILDLTPDKFGGFFNPFYTTLANSGVGYEMNVVKKWQEINSAPNDVVVLLIATSKTINSAPSSSEIRRLQGLSALEGYGNQTLKAGGSNGNLTENRTYSDALKATQSKSNLEVVMYNMIVSVYDACGQAAYVLTNYDVILGEQQRHGVENANRVVEMLRTMSRK